MESRILSLSGLNASRLNNERDAWIYLPPSYDDLQSLRYPVLYMHVGQHVFQSRKRSGETWGLRETLDGLIRNGEIQEIIVVAVEHKQNEGASEYFHDQCAYPIQMLGEQYEFFLIYELKPIIDRMFRTLSDASHTALMGSSAAGLATYNIGMRNPDVFGLLGMLSSFFVHLDEETFVEQKQYRPHKPNPGQKLWLDIGGAEGFFMPIHVRSVAEELLSSGCVQGETLYFYEEPDAAHAETDWGRRAQLPLRFFFGREGVSQRVDLFGPDTVGMEGASATLNAVVTLDNGLMYTDLEGGYTVDHPAILEVTPEGRLHPRKPGETIVRYQNRNLQASMKIAVVEKLSATVTVEVEVSVPDTTPEDASIHAVFKLSKVRKGLYRGTAGLPRGVCFRFKVSRGYEKEEADDQNRPVPYRRLNADRDQKVSYIVDNWIDLPAGEHTKGELS
ncbi:alpha/beta hydrolase-fold protein [Paenibacillus glucanolyticus]|uniref:alpha/beta hydrolase-fold protein n=1 Tax=Paenibacillus glucanolyticus TaxID=59843 RepID=UPI00367AD25E